MPPAPDLWQNLTIAAALGLGVSLILWLLRGYAWIGRVRVSALLAALLGGGYLILRSLNESGAWPALDFVLAAAIMLAANTLLQASDVLLWDYLLGTRRHISVPRLIVDVFNFVVLAAVALAVLNRIFGVDLNAFLVTSTVLSAVIGLALQDTLGNVISGLALQLERPFDVNDWVHISGDDGQVTQVSWRTITLRTRDNHSILIPNASAAKEYIINYSRPTPLQRMHTGVGVAYRHPPGLVKAVLEKAVAEAAGVVSQPPPRALVKEFGDSAVQYDVTYWIVDFARGPEIHDAVMTRLWYALRRAEMTIPFPVRDVTVRTVTDDDEGRALDRLRREVLAELRPLSVLAPLSDAQIEQLARTASLQRYTAGEALVRQGEAGDSLFVLKSGRVRVDKRLEDGSTLTLDRLGPDNFFGEMSLLTGEPRSASVIAEIETEVVIVEKSDLAHALASDFSVLEALSQALEARLSRIVSRGAGLLPEAAAMPRQAALLSRIQRFFGLGTGRLKPPGGTG